VAVRSTTFPKPSKTLNKTIPKSPLWEELKKQLSCDHVAWSLHEQLADLHLAGPAFRATCGSECASV
jgi:hypothetical protein